MGIYIIIKSNVSISHSSRYSARPHQPRAPLISATQVTSWKASVRPGAAGLLIHIECSRVRDSSWMYLTSFVTTLIGIELVAVQRKLPDCVVVGLQPYSARTFHVTITPRIYKGGQGPPPNNHQHLRQYKPHRT